VSGWWRCDWSYPLDSVNNVEHANPWPLINPYSFTVTVSPRSITADGVPNGSATDQDFALFVENGY
jgi:hypothetical protein